MYVYSYIILLYMMNTSTGRRVCIRCYGTLQLLAWLSYASRANESRARQHDRISCCNGAYHEEAIQRRGLVQVALEDHLATRREGRTRTGWRCGHHWRKEGVVSAYGVRSRSNYFQLEFSILFCWLLTIACFFCTFTHRYLTLYLADMRQHVGVAKRKVAAYYNFRKNSPPVGWWVSNSSTNRISDLHPGGKKVDPGHVTGVAAKMDVNQAKPRVNKSMLPKHIGNFVSIVGRTIEVRSGSYLGAFRALVLRIKVSASVSAPRTLPVPRLSRSKQATSKSSRPPSNIHL